MELTNLENKNETNSANKEVDENLKNIPTEAKINENGNATDERKINSFEDVLNMIGTNGKRNYLIFFAGMLCALVGPFHVFSYEFLGLTPNYWCQVEPLQESNWTTEEIRSFSEPKFSALNKSNTNCEIYTYDYTFAAEEGYEWSMKNLKDRILEEKLNPVVFCTVRDFDPTVVSIATDWDLVCDRRAWYSTTQSVTQIGTLIASLICGYLLDAYGRRPVILICSILYIIIGFLTCISNSIILYIVFKLFSSIFSMGFYLGGFVICMEMASPSQRSTVGNLLYPIPWVLGFIMVPVISYFVRPWRWLQAALTAPSLVLLLNVWLLPESPRWLILHSKYDEAYKTLKKIADSNNREFPNKEKLISDFNALKQKEQEEKEIENSIKETIGKIFKRCFSFFTETELRKKSLVVFFCWFSVSLSYYGVSLGSINLGVNTYLYNLISAALEFPSYLILWVAVKYLGRKKTLILFFMLGAAFILVVTIAKLNIIPSSSMVLAVLFLLGKMAITAAYQLIYVVTAELYPTHLRSLAIGMSSSVGRIGSIVSPYINDLLGVFAPYLPALVFGSTSLMAGILCFSFPETSDSILPDEKQQDDTKVEKNDLVKT